MEIDQFFKDLAGSLQAISCCHIPSLTQWDLPACLHTSSALHPQISDILLCVYVKYDSFTMLSVSLNFGKKMFKSC